jgi:hypothetical protein
MIFGPGTFKGFRLRAPRAAYVLCILGSILSACAATHPAPQGAFSTQRFSAFADPTPIAARSQSEIAQAALVARRAETPSSSRAARARVVEATAAPFLYGSPVGRRFLAAAGARALARGYPEAQCPALGLAEGPPSGDPTAVTRAALSGCLGLLADQGRSKECGCRILAVDDILAVPLTDLSYAPGVSARLFGVTGIRPLVAEERGAPDGESTRVAFFDVRGPVAIAELHPDGTAQMLELGEGSVFAGIRELHGWRRGRVAERLLLTGEDGKRVIALIGFEPTDIAAGGAALASWPAKG